MSGMEQGFDREQSARAYTLAEIDAMREALMRRWWRHRNMSHNNQHVVDVERELKTALVGNVEPSDLIAECAKNER